MYWTATAITLWKYYSALLWGYTRLSSSQIYGCFTTLTFSCIFMLCCVLSSVTIQTQGLSHISAYSTSTDGPFIDTAVCLAGNMPDISLVCQRVSTIRVSSFHILPTSSVDDEGKGDVPQAQTESEEFSHIFSADF